MSIVCLFRTNFLEEQFGRLLGICSISCCVILRLLFSHFYSFIAYLSLLTSILMARRRPGIPVNEGAVRHEAALLDHVAEGLGPQRRDVEA